MVRVGEGVFDLLASAVESYPACECGAVLGHRVARRVPDELRCLPQGSSEAVRSVVGKVDLRCLGTTQGTGVLNDGVEDVILHR